MNNLRNYLREYRDLSINCGVRSTFLFRDHVISGYDEFATKRGYNLSSHYSKVTFSKELIVVFNENVTTGHFCSLETVQSVNVTTFQKRMGISAKIIKNIEWKNLNLSDNCIDGPTFLESYKKRIWSLDGLYPDKKRTQYLHEVIPFQICATPEGLEAYFSWMDKVNYIEESFSSNKNLYFQNHMSFRRSEDRFNRLEEWCTRFDIRLVALERILERIERNQERNQREILDNQRKILDILKSLQEQK